MQVVFILTVALLQAGVMLCSTGEQQDLQVIVFREAIRGRRLECVQERERDVEVPVQWLRGSQPGAPLQQQGRMELMRNILRIRHLQLEDEDYYTCCINNATVCSNARSLYSKSSSYLRPMQNYLHI